MAVLRWRSDGEALRGGWHCWGCSKTIEKNKGKRRKRNQPGKIKRREAAQGGRKASLGRQEKSHALEG